MKIAHGWEMGMCSVNKTSVYAVGDVWLGQAICWVHSLKPSGHHEKLHRVLPITGGKEAQLHEVLGIHIYGPGPRLCSPSTGQFFSLIICFLISIWDLVTWSLSNLQVQNSMTASIQHRMGAKLPNSSKSKRMVFFLPSFT